MKKIVVLLLVLLLIFVTSCGKDADQALDGENLGQTENDVIEGSDTPESDFTEPEDNNQNVPEHTHNYNAVVTSPTCSSEGYTTYTCTCGDSYVSDRVGTTNHTYDSTVTAPTCTAEGYTTYTCSACGDTYTDNNTPATGHTEQTLHAVEATCTSTGLTEGKQCSVCGTVNLSQHIVEELATSSSRSYL